MMKEPKYMAFWRCLTGVKQYGTYPNGKAPLFYCLLDIDETQTEGKKEKEQI